MSDFQAKLIDILRASTFVTVDHTAEEREQHLVTLRSLQASTEKEGNFVLGWMDGGVLTTKKSFLADLTQTVRIDKYGWGYVWYLDAEDDKGTSMSVGIRLRFRRQVVQNLSMEHIEEEKAKNAMKKQLALLDKYCISASRLDEFKSDLEEAFRA